jgi:polyisoprenoid-binding protein YceI
MWITLCKGLYSEDSKEDMVIIRKQLLILLVFMNSFVICLNAQEELPKAGRYSIVPGQSRIEVKAGTSGMLGFMGHGHMIAPKTFSGEMELTPKEKIPAKVSVRVDASSLQETAEFKPEEKTKIETQLHAEVLETKKYSEISFQSTNVTYTASPGHAFDVKIEGDLALHGVSRKISVPARIIDDGTNLRATGKFEINRQDYKVETKSAGGGTVKVSKTLEINFDLLLKPQQ